MMKKCYVCGDESGECGHMTPDGKLTDRGVNELLGAAFRFELVNRELVCFVEPNVGRARRKADEWMQRGAKLVAIECPSSPDANWYVYVDLETADLVAHQKLNDLMRADEDDFIAAFEGVR